MDPTSSVRDGSSQNALPAQDPADFAQLQAAIEYRAQALQAFQSHLTTRQAANKQLTQQLHSQPSSAANFLHFILPERFDGSLELKRKMEASDLVSVAMDWTQWPSSTAIHYHYYQQHSNNYERPVFPPS